MLKGLGVSKGIGIGKVFKYIEKPLRYEERAVTDAAAEKQRLGNAVGVFCDHTGALADAMDETDADGQILRGQAAMVNDPSLTASIAGLIDSGICAEKALESACDEIIGLFSASEDELVRQRAADIEDIKHQVLEILLDVECADLKTLPEGTVLAVRELTPSMTVGMNESGVVGIIAEKGGRTSHSAIIARSLGVPTVFGAKGALELLQDGQTVAIDGETGEIFSASEGEFDVLKDKSKKNNNKTTEQAAEFRGKPTVTADGTRKRLLANIDSPRDIGAVLDSDAEGIGLFRTEGFFLDRAVLPSEDEQFEAYKAVAEAMNGREVVIRTLDIGGDKLIPTLEHGAEENPFLGLRAVRYSLKNKGLFKTQLRAILRASAFGNISILIPLVTRVDEVLHVKSMVEELKTELDRDKIPYKRDIKLGVMIETPAACVMADILARHADFFSIGTNDLIGYTMAVDRGNPDVGDIYSAFDPAVLRSVRHVIAVAKQQGKRCSMCGEAAADERLLPVFLAFGLEEFSVSPADVLSVRAKMASLEKGNCDRIAETAMLKETAREVEEYLSK